jgi:hypothetical protein
MTRGTREIIHRLAGLAPWATITDEVFDAVVEDLRDVAQTEEVTKDVVEEIVGKYMSGTGRFKTAGENMSDINALLVALQNPPPSGGTTGRK